MEKPRITRAARCLVVDDDQDFLESIQGFLSEHLPTVVTETQTSVAQALRDLEARAYEIVIADYRMQPTDGMQFLEAARRARPEAKLVLITSHAEIVGDRLDALDELADLVLLKPVQTRPFIDHLRRLLGDRIWGR